MEETGENPYSWLRQALLQERLQIQALLEERHRAILECLGPDNLAPPPPFEAPPPVPGAVGEAWVDHTRGDDNACVAKAAPAGNVSAPSAGAGSGEVSTKNMLSTKSRLSTQPSHLPSFAKPGIDDGERGFLHEVTKLVTGHIFESFFGVLIILNTVEIALKAQYDGLQNGLNVQYPGYTTNPEEQWPVADNIFEILEVIFGAMFVCELVLKLIGLRCDFARSLWNWFDLFLVSSWLAQDIGLSFIPTNFVLLRALRLLRLFRLLKLVRSLGMFDSLFLMTTAMWGSFSVLIWAALLLVIAQTIMGLMIQFLCMDFIQDPTADIAEKQAVFKYYGTFHRSMLTMFEISLGNWIVPCRILMDHVNEGFMLFSICHKLIVGFSMVSVITGVFIQETFKVASTDDKIMLRHKERANNTHRDKMQTLFGMLDENSDGTLDMSEFEEVMRNPSLVMWLAAQELQVADAKDLFKALVGQDGRLSLDQLISGVGTLKGQARSADVAFLRLELQRMHQIVAATHAQLGARYEPTAQSIGVH